ncbi:MAG: nucleotidyltransferase domain-containing protein [Desulfobacterales bacterium]|nr:MAG: nucleotidyltransferase domain-containing protein [Desulfobacterales bacterium]
MPVRSLNSSVLKWPDRDTVAKALRDWAQAQSEEHPELERLGYFGSYARGDWGVGSDLDLIALIGETSEVFERRSLKWDLSVLPVPADLLIFTRQEWRRLQKQGGRFALTLAREVVWIYPPS